jgi:hypothetical protein
MHESAAGFHCIEWPADGARLAGPVAWLRGWIVGRPGHDFTDVRVRHNGGLHLGVLGLPRTDLAAHFQAARPWLPAEFIIGIPVSDGLVTLTLEAMDAPGRWHPLQAITLTIAADGAPSPRIEGRLETSAHGTWTVRDAHHPFSGHLDEPGAAPVLVHGRAGVFGWLLDETRPLAAVLATTDTLVFNHLDHSLTDAALAARVRHPGSGRARLRGMVDFPVTLPDPACLRVYAVSPDGSVHLCFAQRIQPTTAPAAVRIGRPALFPVTHRTLNALPSGRPRRLLLVVRSLLPNDTTLRALDLARHLVSSHRWAVRLVAAEDGPLRADFEAGGVESLVVDPGPFLMAGDAAARDAALQGLQRQIWWQHLDTVAVFDPVCGWATILARRQKIPVLLDCSETTPMEPDPTGSPAVQGLLFESWRSATVVCFASQAAAQAQQGRCGDRPAEIIAQWHTPGLLTGTDPTVGRTVFAPLRTVDWLVRYHPATAARWIFRQGPAGQIDHDRLVRRDESLGAPAMQASSNWSMTDATLCLGPLFGRGLLRPVIDAAAAGRPVAAPRVSLTEEIFLGTRVPLVDEANPLALAHELLAWSALPDGRQREAAALAPAFRTRHDPARLLPQWERLLATTAADRG